MKETDIAWAAGFIDGEGSLNIQHLKKHWTRKRDGKLLYYSYFVLQLMASQKSEEPLCKLQELFGGTILKRKYCGVGIWAIQGPKAAFAISKMLPYLTTKREQASIAIEYRKLVGINNNPHNRNYKIADQMLSLREELIAARRKANA
jgi:LAGLIDADG endonuclease